MKDAMVIFSKQPEIIEHSQSSDTRKKRLTMKMNTDQILRYSQDPRSRANQIQLIQKRKGLDFSQQHEPIHEHSLLNNTMPPKIQVFDFLKKNQVSRGQISHGSNQFSQPETQAFTQTIQSTVQSSSPQLKSNEMQQPARLTLQKL